MFWIRLVQYTQHVYLIAYLRLVFLLFFYNGRTEHLILGYTCTLYNIHRIIWYSLHTQTQIAMFAWCVFVVGLHRRPWTCNTILTSGKTLHTERIYKEEKRERQYTKDKSSEGNEQILYTYIHLNIYIYIYPLFSFLLLLLFYIGS